MIKTRNGLLVFVIIALLGLCGCSLFPTIIGESDVGSIQTLDVGDLLQIQLMGNASTGYEWVRVEPASLAGSALEIVKEGDYQMLGCDLVGGPGEFIFHYRALRPGTVTLAFEHRRPWEAEDPVDSYSVTIWVR